jgi:four helix bundle protein
MRNPELQDRTKRFALRIVKMFGSLPRRVEADVLGRQVLRSGTGVAANYREACRACSRAELVSKLGQVEQELDETLLWLELLVESGLVPAKRMSLLTQEAEELLRSYGFFHQDLEAKEPALILAFPIPHSPFPISPFET